MPKVIFRGENASGYTRCWGYTFPTGEAVEVDAAAVKQADGHPEFEVVPDKAENPPAEKEKPVSAPKTAAKLKAAPKPRKKAGK